MESFSFSLQKRFEKCELQITIVEVLKDTVNCLSNFQFQKKILILI